MVAFSMLPWCPFSANRILKYTWPYVIIFFLMLKRIFRSLLVHAFKCFLSGWNYHQVLVNMWHSWLILANVPSEVPPSPSERSKSYPLLSVWYFLSRAEFGVVTNWPPCCQFHPTLSFVGRLCIYPQTGLLRYWALPVSEMVHCS